jgi:hypothetical protein
MKISICITILTLVMITMQSPMDGSAPNSPIIQDVNWSDLEDIVSLEHEHVASSPTHSTNQESTSLPIRKKKKKDNHQVNCN